MRLLTIAAMALFAFSLGITSFQSDANAGRRGRNVAIGVGVGLATMAIIAGAANANERRRGRNSCARLMEACDDGEDWACEKYERRCD